jgi:thiol:disulfide interchange protein
VRRCSAALMLPTLLAVSLAAAPGSLGYDPEADPAEGLRAATEEARASGRRILVVVGGDWCSWCHTLDRFVKGNEAVHALWNRAYVTLKVHWDREHPNEAFLARYPAIEGYPHIFVLDGDGALLHSQNTGELEEGDSYSPDLVIAFLTRWAPPAPEKKS